MAAKEYGARERLLEAATALFAEKGYAAASVREIVAQAGVSNPVLYYHFKNKEGLYRTVMEEEARAFFVKLEEAVDRPETGADSGQRLRERIVSVLQVYIYYINERPECLRIGFQSLFGPRGASPDFSWESFIEREHRVVEKVFEKGHDEGSLAPEVSVEAAAEQIVALTLLLCVNRAIGLIERVDGGESERIADQILYGVSPNGGTQKSATALRRCDGAET